MTRFPPTLQKIYEEEARKDISFLDNLLENIDSLEINGNKTLIKFKIVETKCLIGMSKMVLSLSTSNGLNDFSDFKEIKGIIKDRISSLCRITFK